MQGSVLAHTLNDLLFRFAALADEPEPVRDVRGITLAVAQYWLIKLPDSPSKVEALDYLSLAREAACKAAAGG